jgi:hypothetical protein
MAAYGIIKNMSLSTQKFYPGSERGGEGETGHAPASGGGFGGGGAMPVPDISEVPAEVGGMTHAPKRGQQQRLNDHFNRGAGGQGGRPAPAEGEPVGESAEGTSEGAEVAGAGAVEDAGA